MKSLNKLMRGNKGATAVEYAIIAALVAAASVAAFGLLGENIGSGVNTVADSVVAP